MTLVQLMELACMEMIGEQLNDHAAPWEVILGLEWLRKVS